MKKVARRTSWLTYSSIMKMEAKCYNETSDDFQQIAGRNIIKIANRCFENVTQFRYLGTTVTNQNLIQEEIKRRLNSGNACYHSVQNLFSSHLLSKSIKIKIYNSACSSVWV
jgi:hypothetical protein